MILWYLNLVICVVDYIYQICILLCLCISAMKSYFDVLWIHSICQYFADYFCKYVHKENQTEFLFICRKMTQVGIRVAAIFISSIISSNSKSPSSIFSILLCRFLQFLNFSLLNSPHWVFFFCVYSISTFRFEMSYLLFLLFVVFSKIFLKDFFISSLRVSIIFSQAHLRFFSSWLGYVVICKAWSVGVAGL